MNLLLAITYFPLFAVFIIGLLPKHNLALLRSVALILSFSLLFLFVILLSLFDKSFVGYQFTYSLCNLTFLNSNYIIAVDGISILFIGLTIFLIPICILCSFANIKFRFKEFILLLFLIEFFLFNVFTVLDMFLFYVFFEAILMPMYLMIGIWGSRIQKIKASFEFFYFTLLGSLLFLLAVLTLISTYGTSNLFYLLTFDLDTFTQTLCFLAFFLAFAIKMPLYPFHIWLPKAHVEAPTAGSVLLAGILLKMGGYGLLRFLIPLFPEATIRFLPLVFLLSVLGIIYCAFSAIRQIDIKRTIAYSSVCHMSLITLGIFSHSLMGLQGAMISMISHGVVSGGLFICAGILYDRYKTKNIFYYGGLAQIMPKFSVVFFIFTLANTGFPGTSSFVGEFLIFISIFQLSPFLCLVSLSSIITSAIYSFWLFNKIMLGPFSLFFRFLLSDLIFLEKNSLYPLIFFVFFIGIYPQFIFDFTDVALKNIMLYF